ncbi:MAG: YetF domain-containing protein [Phycisphaeraceae bacterium]
MEDLFFAGWDVLFRTLVVGVLAYAGLIVLLRGSGKRTLSKMNAFDFIVTVALGSTLATILLSNDVALAQGLLALALLIGLQFVVTWSSVRTRWVRTLMTGEPSLLLYQGAYLRSALRRVRVTEDEVRSAIRAAGFGSVEEVEAVVLETDGSISVIQHADEKSTSSLVDIRNPVHENETE